MAPQNAKRHRRRRQKIPSAAGDSDKKKFFKRTKNQFLNRVKLKIQKMSF
jgi:hypothetical protein